MRYHTLRSDKGPSAKYSSHSETLRKVVDSKRSGSIARRPALRSSDREERRVSVIEGIEKGEPQ